MQDQLYVNQSGIIYLRRNGEDIEISDQEKAVNEIWYEHCKSATTGINYFEWKQNLKPGIYPIPDLQETDPLDKFMDEEIAYLKSCNPMDKWGRLENQFAAGMIHAYERIKAEREYIAHHNQT